MGAKHSKPRLRRNRRCSSVRKRQAPEGSNDPSPPPNEVYNCGNTNKSHGLDDGCKYCGAQNGFHSESPRIRRQAKIYDNDVKKPDVLHPDKRELYNTGFTAPIDLKVNLPSVGKSDRCGRWEYGDKSRTLPVKSTSPGANKSTMEKDDEQEWTITLYEIDKTSSQVPCRDMAALMSSIYDAVNDKAEESPDCRKTVRVRLSVTPERTVHSRLQSVQPHVYREQTGCSCSACPKTEPSSRKGFDYSKSKLRRCDTSSPIRSCSSHSTRPTRHDSHRAPRDHSSENCDRRKHQTTLRDPENDTSFCNKSSLPPDSRNVLDRTKSLPQSRHRPWTKIEGQRQSHSKSTYKRYVNASEHRYVSHKGRKKEPKFASPYDQHFQEAMYLRLRELQRQGAFERRRAIAGQDSDDADDDSDCDLNNDSIKPIKQKESAGTSSIRETNQAHAHEGLPTSSTEQCLPAVGSVHHYHYIYHNGSFETTEASSGLAVNCIQKAVKSIRSEVENIDNSIRPNHHIHHHHYHLADTS